MSNGCARFGPGHDEKIYDRLDRIYELRDGQLIETEERVAA